MKAELAEAVEAVKRIKKHQHKQKRWNDENSSTEQLQENGQIL